ncbi:cation:proton antiporter domain-containing protein [Mycoplasma struthionis]|uniref:Sodium:proton antiporter n=1 Tax=Mycoplasma struthionis TaxID=538220 RepID=A0A3G8LGL7_9MOLU|nr:cation:proton antiporter [Mycoplasma struthionis]AZG68534.1 sodium:proton antiporter [Mycoplasma struthionis]
MINNFFLTFALVLFSAFLFGKLFKLIKLPQLIGYLLAGLIFGPTLFNFTNPLLLQIGSHLRRVALFIILMRSGTSLKLNELKKIGLTSLLLSFIPATFEITAFVILGPLLLNLSYLDSAILGCIIAAVSPAIIVPRMIKLKEAGYSKDSKLPSTIMAGSSLDDIFVLSVFSVLLNIKKNETNLVKKSFDYFEIFNIPNSIILAIALGIVLGFLVVEFYKATKLKKEFRLIILIILAFALYGIEEALSSIKMNFASLLSLFILSIYVANYDSENLRFYSKNLERSWIFFEAVLFSLIGLITHIKFDLKSTILNLKSLGLIILAMLIRSIGTILCFIKSKTTLKEKIFAIFAYLPKATVQASLASIPLQSGIPSGEIMLVVGVISIIFSAPTFALILDLSYPKLLKKM